MKSNAPWSVKGIERDARETAKEAARREGMTVGEWLNQIIYSHSEGGAPAALADSEIEGLKLRDIVTAIEHLRNRVVETESKNARAASELTRNMGVFVERVQRLERIKPAAGTYEDLAGRLERVEQASGDRNRIEALKALEKAIAQVAVQFNNAQRTTITRLDSAEAQLQEFAERIDRVGGGEEPAEVGALKSAIDNLAQRVARAERIAGEAAALKEAAAGSADPEFVERTGARLRVLGDEIKRGGDQIRSLEGLITKLSSQIEAAEKRSAEGVQKVAETIADVRTQLLTEDARADESPDVEAILAKARAETETKLVALERSLAEMNARVEDMNRAAQARAAIAAAAMQPAPPAPMQAPAPAPAKPAAFAAPKPPTLSAPIAVPVASAPVVDNAMDEIEEAVAALEADDVPAAVKAPFAFDDAIDADDEAASRASTEDDSDDADDFRFELDEEEDEDGEISVASEDDDAPQAGVADDGDEETDPGKRDARSLLAEVRSALTGEGLDDIVDDDDDELDVADEAEDLGNVGNTAADREDDEDEQAPNTASLAAGMAIDTDAPKPAPETPPAPAKEDLIQAARRRAQEAHAAKADEAAASGGVRRSQLTAKQRAILAARARQKQAAQEEASTPQSAPKPAALAPEAKAPPAPAAAADDFAAHMATDTDEEKSGGRLAKFTSMLAAARARITRKDDDADAPAAAAPHADEDEKPHRNHDREALQSIQTNSSIKKVTMAIAVAILLAIAALAFLMKDIVMKPSGRRPAAATVTQQQPAPTTTTTGEATLAEVPAAPAIDPKALYKESLAALNAATSEADASAAIGKLEEAAALGHPPAQLQLGELYKTGQGVEQDFGQARIWFRRAANGGNVLAMHRLGVMTARGDGGPADSAEAISWFERAANLGLVDSQYNLGAIYHPSGEGGSTVQNAGKAYFWYSLAARNGDTQAGSLAAGVAATIPAAERAEIDASVDEWSADPADTEANANAASE